MSRRDHRIAFARAVREIRVRRGLRQEDVQATAGLGRNYMTTREGGRVNPSLEAIIALARGLG
ncbi:MAG TPA: helix-turn-helix transcriptional regulator, partial [Solirubrobacteraceae bacterium]